MKQKTCCNTSLLALDDEVNNFEAENIVRATQSYYANGLHCRVLFYEEKK